MADRIPESFEISRATFSRVPIQAPALSVPPIDASGRDLQQALGAIRQQVNDRLRSLTVSYNQALASIAQQTSLRLLESSLSFEAVVISLEAALEQLRTAVNDIEGTKRLFQKSLQVAYYGGASAPESRIDDDLAALAAAGWGGVRVWASWFWEGLTQDLYSPLKADGSVNTERMDRLRYLIGKAYDLELFVDVTLSRGKLPTMEAQRTGMKNLVDAIGEYDGIVLDVVNEWNGVQQAGEVAELTRYAKELAPAWKITASTQGPTGQQVNAYADLWSNDAYLDEFTPHFLRSEDWWEATDDRIVELREGIRERSGATKVRPIYLQEENLRNNSEAVSAESLSAKSFIAAAINAKKAGAISWGFMTRAGFDLRSRSLYDQADEVELEILETLPNEVRSA